MIPWVNKNNMYIFIFCYSAFPNQIMSNSIVLGSFQISFCWTAQGGLDRESENREKPADDCGSLKTI